MDLRTNFFLCFVMFELDHEVGNILEVFFEIDVFHNLDKPEFIFLLQVGHFFTSFFLVIKKFITVYIIFINEGKLLVFLSLSKKLYFLYLSEKTESFSNFSLHLLLIEIVRQSSKVNPISFLVPRMML